MARGNKGASVARRIKRSMTEKTQVIVSTQLDETAAVALDTLVQRLSISDGRPQSVSATVRRAVVFMERMTRKGGEE